ncbi:MAG: FprA family A-type flavoprotein [Treponema sp.]|nr:FprA family A-type flavoprotein [Treponema sp.]
MKISDAVKYVGVNDHDIDLFEGQFEVPLGMAYNSYLILDDKVAVMDSVDGRFGDQWLANIQKELGGRKPDYLVVHHMEMDHSAAIRKFAEAYPTAVIAASKMAFTMLKSYFGDEFAAAIAPRQLAVGEGSTLELGTHSLQFIAAPNVHWPEVLMSYEKQEKILFSADAFGKFGANDVEDPEGWTCEARRYYFGIVGKFGPQVQTVLKKAAALDIQKICSLHGPVLDEGIADCLKLYDTWSSYGVESEGVMIAYTSVYGNTKKAVEKLAELLTKQGCPKVVVADLAREDVYENVENAFRYGRLVLASTTYNGGVFPVMREFIEHLTERNYQKRKIAFIENGSWAPAAAKAMRALFDKGLEAGCKDLSFAESKVSIKIAMSEKNLQEMEALARELLA